MSYTKTKRVFQSGPHEIVTYERKNQSSTSTTETRNCGPFTCTVTLGENPYWRRQVLLGQNATTGMTGEEYRINTWSGGNQFQKDLFVEWWQPTGTAISVQRTGMLTSYHSFPPDGPSNLSGVDATNQAKTRFLQQLTAAQRSFEGGVFLGELAETLHMMRSRSLKLKSGLWDYITDARKRRRRARGPKNQLKEVTNSYLEYSYGWAPLFNDIDNAGRTINRWNDWDNPRIQLKAVGESTWLDLEQNLQGSAVGFETLTNRRNSSTTQVIFRGATISRPMSPLQYQARLMGFSPQNFLPTVWELIPYSFLVDYFSNVGDVIMGWSFQRAGLAWCNITERRVRRCYVHHKAVRTTYAGWTMLENSPSVSDVERRYVTRSVYLGSFTPSLEFQIPGIGNARKYLNISALIAAAKLR